MSRLNCWAYFIQPLRTQKFPFQVKEFFTSAVGSCLTCDEQRQQLQDDKRLKIWTLWFLMDGPKSFQPGAASLLYFWQNHRFVVVWLGFSTNFLPPYAAAWERKRWLVSLVIRTRGRVALSTRTFWRTLYQLSYRAGANLPTHSKNDAAFFLQCIIVKKSRMAALLKPCDLDT